MPIFAGYATDDFWDYLQVYYDQPIVGLNPNNFMIFVSPPAGAEGVLQPGKFYMPSSASSLCTQLGKENCKTLSLDKPELKNTITKEDEIEISFKLEEPIQNIKFMAFLDYGINSRIKFLMHTLLYLDIDINGEARIETNGELILKQRAPFTSTTITNKQYYNNEYILDANKINPFDFSAIFDEFKNRNYTTEYKHSVRSISEDTTGTESTSQSSKIEVDIKIHIPKAQKILYQQKTYDNLKKAWIQYIFIFIPIFLVVYYLLSFILTNPVFPCSMKSDLGRF